jgi:hypothetical protein
MRVGVVGVQVVAVKGEEGFYFGVEAVEVFVFQGIAAGDLLDDVAEGREDALRFQQGFYLGEGLGDGEEVQGLPDGYEVVFEGLVVFGDIADIDMHVGLGIECGERGDVFACVFDHSWADVDSSVVREVGSESEEQLSRAGGDIQVPVFVGDPAERVLDECGGVAWSELVVGCALRGEPEYIHAIPK